ncbi:MAG: CDP-alcohol phosphatidyltransferase family protein [Candidatus Dependentiae bacterium]|jgi:CDP-diacylglycerol--glycerol-3-phosphate 3-phosphatidyltransferase
MTSAKKPRLLARIYTISNVLTFSRLLMAPLMVYTLSTKLWFYSALLFAAAALSDTLDGYLARRFNEPTVLGTYLDPLADKVFFTSCFFTLWFVQFPSLPIPWWFVGVVVVREFVLLCGALYVLLRMPRIPVQPTRSGKLTTVGYCLVIGWTFACYFFGWMPVKTFTAVLLGVTALSLFSFIYYLRRAISLLV